MERTDGFSHAVDKSAIPAVNILGVDIAAVDLPWLTDFLMDHVRELSGDYVCVSNVHTTVMSMEDPSYRAVQNGGILAVPDGGPLSAVGRRRGAAHMGRTAGPDIMDAVFRASAGKGYRHYFYGSSPETLDALRENLSRRFPGLTIAGLESPPFRPLTEEEDRAAVERINTASPDFLWVGLGAPKQERWMAAHQGRVRGLMLGVGAGFDYFAGNISRAPRWMRDHSLEWLWRLVQDPKRLFARYAVTNTKFIWHAVIRGK